jgi:putative hydrolase of the HAD superfamily
MNKKYTHIFFDLDNTLWDFEKNSRNAMLDAFHHFKLESVTTFDLFFETYTKHNNALWASYRTKELAKKDLTRLRFQNTFDDLNIIGVVADEMNTVYLSEMPKQKVLFDGVIDLLDYLKRKRYQLNIITNGFSEVQRKKLETSGLKPYFNKIFISEEIKSPKPSREIFEYAIKSSNAKKINSLMIGDDWDVDVMGAVHFGIDSVHFQNSADKKLQRLENPLKSNFEIYSIGSIENLRLLL